MSKGINVYEEARRYFGRANESVMLENFSGDEDPCIFLSHRRCDKAAVKKIGDYIQNAGINIYLDAVRGRIKTSQQRSNQNQPV